MHKNDLGDKEEVQNLLKVKENFKIWQKYQEGQELLFAERQK